MSAFRGEPKAPAIFLRTDSSQHWKGKARFARNGLDRAGDAPDDTALVDAPVELNHDLTRPVVIDEFELVDVTYGGKMGEVHKVTTVSRKSACRLRGTRAGSAHGENSLGGHSPCFCMTWRNLITTLDTGRTKTWRFPRFSALYMACRRRGVQGLARKP